MQLLRKTAVLSLVLLAGAILILGCGPKPVAQVDGQKITTETYTAELERLRQPSSPKTLGEMVLDKLITEQVVLNAARKQGVAPTQEDLDNDLKVMQLDPQFDQRLKDSGRTLDDIKKDNQVEMALMHLYTKGIKVSQKEIDDAYNREKGLFPHTIPPIAHAQIIAVPTLDEAKKVLQMLDKKADFGMLAQEKSIDPSKSRNGDMGPIMLSEVVPGIDPTVAKALKTLPIGQPSEPIDIRTQDQMVYVIVKVNSRTQPKTIPRSLSNWVIRRDLLMMKAREKQKPIEEFVQSLKDKAQVEIYRDSVKNALKTTPTPAAP